MNLFLKVIIILIFLPLISYALNPTISSNKLFNAIYDNQPHIIEQYIKNGGDPNVKESRGKDSLLVAAIDNSRYDIVGLLIESGAQITEFDIMHAIGRGEIKIYNDFLKSETNKLNPIWKNQLLEVACECSYKGYLKIVNELIDIGADPTAIIPGEICDKNPIFTAYRIKNELNNDEAAKILDLLLSTIKSKTDLTKDKILEEYLKKFECHPD